MISVLDCDVYCSIHVKVAMLSWDATIINDHQEIAGQHSGYVVSPSALFKSPLDTIFTDFEGSFPQQSGARCSAVRLTHLLLMRMPYNSAEQAHFTAHRSVV